MRRKNKPARAALILATCVLAVPTVACLMYGAPERMNFEIVAPMLAAGAVLGLSHLILRPLLRLITAPLGCITFGLSGTAIDIALIYLSAGFVPYFFVPNFSYALLTALAINAIIAFTGARKS